MVRRPATRAVETSFRLPAPDWLGKPHCATPPCERDTWLHPPPSSDAEGKSLAQCARSRIAGPHLASSAQSGSAHGTASTAPGRLANLQWPGQGERHVHCAGGGIGRRPGLKIPYPKGCTGSIPVPRTKTHRAQPNGPVTQGPWRGPAHKTSNAVHRSIDCWLRARRLATVATVSRPANISMYVSGSGTGAASVAISAPESASL